MPGPQLALRIRQSSIWTATVRVRGSQHGRDRFHRAVERVLGIALDAEVGGLADLQLGDLGLVGLDDHLHLGGIRVRTVADGLTVVPGRALISTTTPLIGAMSVASRSRERASSACAYASSTVLWAALISSGEAGAFARFTCELATSSSARAWSRSKAVDERRISSCACWASSRSRRAASTAALRTRVGWPP